MRVADFDARQSANQLDGMTGSASTCSSIPIARNSVQLPLVFLNKIRRAANTTSVSAPVVSRGGSTAEQSKIPLSEQEPSRISLIVSSGLENGNRVLFLRRS